MVNQWFSKKSSRKKPTKAKKGSTTKKASTKAKTPRKSQKARSPAKENLTKVKKKSDQKDSSSRKKEDKKKKAISKEFNFKGEKATIDCDEDHPSNVPGSSIHSRIEKPKKVKIQNHEIDEEKMKTLLFKLKKDKLSARPKPPPLDPKAKLLMDRVVKKPYPLKYATRNKDLQMFDETSSFFRPSKSPASSEDTYCHYPKLEDVRKLPEENVFTSPGIPYWAERTEPDDRDLVDVDPPISVGSDHVELYQDKRLTLKTIKDVKLVLDVYQLLVEIVKQDEVHFHPHQVFSNTVRSLVNVQQGGKSESSVTKRTEDEDGGKKARFNLEATSFFCYSRLNPIQTSRHSRIAEVKRVSVTTTTTTEGSAEHA